MKPPATPYPNYAQARNEEVIWFARPVYIGILLNVAGQELVALRLNSRMEPRTVEALIIDRQDAPGQKPMLLGRLWKWTTNFNVKFDQAALKQLAKDYGLIISEP